MINPIEFVNKDNKNDIEVDIDNNKAKIKTKIISDKYSTEAKININGDKKKGTLNASHIGPNSKVNINTNFDIFSIVKAFRKIKSLLR